MVWCPPSKICDLDFIRITYFQSFAPKMLELNVTGQHKSPTSRLSCLPTLGDVLSSGNSCSGSVITFVTCLLEKNISFRLRSTLGVFRVQLHAHRTPKIRVERLSDTSHVCVLDVDLDHKECCSRGRSQSKRQRHGEVDAVRKYMSFRWPVFIEIAS